MDALEAALPVPVDQFDAVAGLEARGFLFGPALAARLGKGFVAVRKAGKLPPETVHEDYALEYGTASIEIETSAVKPGDRVLVVDDLIATGGTAKAAADLIEKCGGTVVGFSFVMELEGLSRNRRAGGIPAEHAGHHAGLNVNVSITIEEGKPDGSLRKSSQGAAGRAGDLR